MTIEADYVLAPSASVQPKDRVVAIIGGVTLLDGADLLSPNRFAKNLRTRLGLMRTHLRSATNLRWCSGWPGTEGPSRLKADVVFGQPLSSLTTDTVRAIEVTDILLVDHVGVRAFTITELGEVYVRRQHRSPLLDDGRRVAPEVVQWLLSA